MHEFAEEYVANLKPRDERYDTRLGDDFFVATFPNGIKTWAYVYQVNGFTRRQTLGVYPEMSLPQALEALYAARRTRAVEAELADQGLDGAQVRQTEDSPIDLTAKLIRPTIRLPTVSRRFLAGVATGAGVSLTLAAAAWWFLAPTPTAAIAAQSAIADTRPAMRAAETETLIPDSVPDEAAAAPLPEPEPQAVAEKLAPPVAVAPETLADSAASATVPDAVPEPVKMGTSQQAVRQLQQELAGTLAWAQLTSDVKNGEPVDQLSWLVELDHAPRRVFYFVRVRGLAGGMVTYRWRHEEKLLKEDAVRVGQGWHSPAYSGMTLTQDRLGHWQVEVLGPDGQSLGSEEFETRLTKDAPRLSQR